MPIDPTKAIGAELPTRELSWTSTDVLLYHLTLGAHADELHYVYERGLRVLPTFAVVTGTLRETGAPSLDMPGVDVDLVNALHGWQELVVHQPLPAQAATQERSRVVDIHDKGNAAVVVVESATEFFTARKGIFLRGEGGFGGDRGASDRVPVPDRRPDAVLLSPTSPSQAAWYRLCGDRNPLHIDPGFAARAGFPRPILHGLCTYGIVAKAVTDELLEAEPGRIGAYRVRFSGIVFPGETLRTRVWREDDRLLLVTTVVERDDAPALSDAVLTLR